MIVPIYLSIGFLESGKAIPIKETLLDTGFNTGERTLLLACEEGMEDYDDDFLTKTNITLVTVDNEAAMSYGFLKKCDSLVEPDQVMTKLNGTWNLNSSMGVEYPFDWLLVQILSTVDVPTFEVHLNNIHSLIYDQPLHSEMIIFNRCNEITRKLCLGNSIKAINESAQLIYEAGGGQIMKPGDGETPFDLHTDVTCIADGDYGLWCMDALEHLHKYEGRSVELKGKVIAARVDGIPNAFVFGHYAIVCCADDTSLIGLLCRYEHASNLIPKDWISITAQIAVEFGEEYRRDVPILYVKQLAEVLPLDDELVYFN